MLGVVEEGCDRLEGWPGEKDLKSWGQSFMDVLERKAGLDEVTLRYVMALGYYELR